MQWISPYMELFNLVAEKSVEDTDKQEKVPGVSVGVVQVVGY